MLYLTLFLGIVSVLGNKECYQSYSESDCYDEDLTDTTQITCGGYASCYDSTFDAPVVDCPGQSGCYLGSITSAEYVRCYGAYSCYDMTTTSSSIDATSWNSGFFCGSLNSCSLSELYTPYIRGDGYISVKDSNIYATPGTNGEAQFYFKGGWSAYSSDIYSNGVDIYIGFDGYNSANVATVFCESGDTCTIACTENACSNDTTYGLTIVEESGSTVSLTCEEGGSNCAIWVTLSSTNKMKGKKKKLSSMPDNVNEKGQNIISMANINKHANIEDNSWSTTEWSYCQYEGNCSYSSYSDFYAVACRGMDSCTDSTFDAFTYYFSAYGYYAGKESTLENGPDLQCHGYRSCDGATLNDNTNVWVSGYNALEDATINDCAYIVSSTSGTFAGATINADDTSLTLWAQAENFAGATINVNGQTANIYFLGYYAGTNAEIYCRDGATCNIYCGASDCSNIYIYESLDSAVTLTCEDISSDHCPVITEEQTFEPTTEPTLSPTLEILYCNATDQCIGTNTAEIIYADGLFAANGATLNGDIIRCTGEYTTSEKTCIKSNINANEVTCDGYHVCWDTDIVAETLSCIGAGVCFQAVATVSEYIECIEGVSTDRVMCSLMTLNVDTDGFEANFMGTWAFKESSMYVSDNVGVITINIDGYENSIYSTFVSGENNDIYINSYGQNALAHATLFCQTGSKCYVYCNEVTACNAFTQYCDGSIYNGIQFNGTCVSASSPTTIRVTSGSTFSLFFKNNKYLINYAVGILFCVILSGLCYYNKDKLTSRIGYEPIPDSPM